MMQNGTVDSDPVQNGVHGVTTNGEAGPDTIHFKTKSKMSCLGLDSDMRVDVDNVKDSSNVLLIWRDNKGNMDRVPVEEYGKFYMGDCYIVYNAHKKKGCSKTVKHIHFLIGCESEGQDEQMDVALFATMLDNYLGGEAVQYRELMGHESAVFKCIFNGRRTPPIRYVKGGYDSRLKKVDPNYNKTQLYEIKGARIAQAKEIEVKLASLNSDDCYVLDGGKKLFVILGDKCNMNEQSKAIKLAYSIRDNEQGGKGKVVIIDEKELDNHEDSSEIRRLFQLPITARLKFGNLKRLQAQSDEEADKIARSSKLYKISDVGDKVEVKDIGSPKQSLLDEKDCFIVFTGDIVFVWKGRKASKTEREEAMKTAKEFLKMLGENPNLGIVVMPQFAETAAFRACFPEWRNENELSSIDIDYSRPNIRRVEKSSVHTVIDFRKLHEKPKQRQIEDPYSSDNGQSKDLTIYRVNDTSADEDMTQVTSGRDMVFNSNDTYVLIYKFYDSRNKECKIIYFWLGNDCSQLKKGTASKIASDLDERLFDGLAVQERVIENKEPPHFMRIFNGFIIVKQEHFNNNDAHLYHVRAKRENDARVVEVEVDASKLNTNDNFILDSGKEMFLWYGKGSTGDERKVVKEAVVKLDPKRGASGNHVFYEEGEERKDFWDAIGGQKEYVKELLPTVQEHCTEHEPRLFHCYNIGRGLQEEEVYDFDQDDLLPEDVFFLDTYYRLYVWLGKGATKDEKCQIVGFVQKYIEADPTHRNGLDTNITVMRQGAELDAFKAYFGDWEDHRTEQLSAEDRKRLAMDRGIQSIDLHQDFEHDDPEGIYSLAELQLPADELPYGIDVKKREMYLKDDEFLEIFRMTKEEYKELPQWKRDSMRKCHKLF